MRTKQTMLIVGLLMYALGASADNAYYRWNSSGNLTISETLTFSFRKGASLSLTVKGSGRLSFHAYGQGLYYINSDTPNNATSLPYDIDYGVNFQGDGEHTIRWYTPNTTQSYGDPWGRVSSIKWNGVSLQYAAVVEFNANGGECECTHSHVKFGGLAGTLPTPTRVGNTFCGWYTAASGGTQISETTTVSANTTYYAHWTVNQYTVTFDANGGTGGTTKVIDYDSELGILPTPLRDDYDFEGWFTATSGGSQVSASTSVIDDETYYAHWLDPVPELPGNPTSEDVARALEDATDYMLSDKIKTVATYTAYRQWITDKSIAHKLARSSPNAWLAYVLDSPELIAKEGAVENKDFKVDKLDMLNGSAGGMDFTFGIEDTVVGEEAEIDEAFEIEGSETLDDSSFSTEGLQVSLDRTADGRVKATVTPPAGKTTYFIRVKIK